MTTEGTGESWAVAYAARAAAHWTPTRTRNLLGDKHLLLPPAESGPLLRALGLLRGDASMSPDSVRKFMQINHMVALLDPLMLDLVRTQPLVRVLDVGCGRSYLSLLLAWSFHRRYRHPAQVLGVDRNAELIDTCRRRLELAGLDEVLRFEATSIETLDVEAAWNEAFGRSPAPPHVHVIVALHACDGATDDALALGVRLEADVIAAAPCCHAELAAQWAKLEDAGTATPLFPVWSSPHLRREAAATMTDALRTLLLRGCGYTVTPMEFVPSTHTPKNTLLRAVRKTGHDEGALTAYLALRETLGGAPIRLERILPVELRTRLRAIEAAC